MLTPYHEAVSSTGGYVRTLVTLVFLLGTGQVTVSSAGAATIQSCEGQFCSVPLGPGLNEPEGHVEIFAVDGSSKDWGAPNYGRAWGDPTDPTQPIQTSRDFDGFNVVHVVPDAGAPTGSAVEFVYARGKKDGFAGAAFFPRWPGGETYRDLYIRLLYKMDARWTHHSTGTTKILYFGYGGGRPGSPTQFYLSNRRGKVEVIDQSGDGNNPIHQAADVTMQPGRWYLIELVIRGQSSLRSADGSLDMWINGNRVTNWVQRKRNEPSASPSSPSWRWVDGSRGATHTRFTGAQLGGWYGGSARREPGKPRDEWIRWGALYISGRP